ncbi:MAG: hypothetical protein EPN34_01235 [Burkholderiaceae bacterium]|nr:MAG: hypothetical protein EPN34_01235 [Burkholderiaceae bacterium]
MQKLERVHLVQFFLFERKTLELDTTTAIIAPNGAGKSALLDALQIVLLGGDRNRIRFNAQAGGTTRARTLRDYCLGVWRNDAGGRKRRTATTYITLVFRDEGTGVPLSAGMALGASADEPDHRLYGRYIVPGVALTLEDHLERDGERELPLAWTTFRELIAQRCREAGTHPELHGGGERFVADLLFRLRPTPDAHTDVNAYRKAFANALNLQHVDDVDLFVRTLVAEDRPTDVARFRSVLLQFRELKEKVEKTIARIATAEDVAAQYRKIATHVARAASHRALGAQYARDLLMEQAGSADRAHVIAEKETKAAKRVLDEIDTTLDALKKEVEHAQVQLSGMPGYGGQVEFKDAVERGRKELARIQHQLTRNIQSVRDAWQAVVELQLPVLEPSALQGAQAAWNACYAQLSTLQAGAALPWSAEALYATAHEALTAAQPLLAVVNEHARTQHTLLGQAQKRRDTARSNLDRLAAGRAELSTDVIRLMACLEEADIPAQPVCDLVRITDTRWQGAIEAYLRTNVEALLVAPEDEERAVRLYRELRGPRAVYGVKLALASQARHPMRAPEPGSVAALLAGSNADALAFLRRQLGDLQCVESEAELIAARRGLTRDGLLAKGGSVERLRLPDAASCKIGARDDRERLRILQDDVTDAEKDIRDLKPEVERADACQRQIAQLANPDKVAQTLHALVLEHTQAERNLRAIREKHEQAENPDLICATERMSALKKELTELGARRDTQLSTHTRCADGEVQASDLAKALHAQADQARADAEEAVRAADVDLMLLPRLREEINALPLDLKARSDQCGQRAGQNDGQWRKLLPEAWGALSQYARDHAVELPPAADDWRAAQALLAGELQRLRESELANYQTQAAQAYDTAIDTFRSNVASVLHDNFERLQRQIAHLNRTLRASPAFSNDERYQFCYEVAPEYRELHRFIQRVDEIGGADNLFGSAGDVPPAFRDLMEDSAGNRAQASPLDDYRRFYHFEVDLLQHGERVGTLSQRMRSGSGGEHRAPLYVIAGAALAAAYGKSTARPGGLGLILLDEFGDKIDAQNARAVVDYLRSLQLQPVLAAPDTAQGALSGVLDSYIEMFRDGDLLQAERVQIGQAARELLLSDQFDLHPELLTAEIARLERDEAAS